MQLVRKTDIAGALPRTIEFNFDELKAELDAKLAKYGERNDTDADTYRERKGDRARLNELYRAIAKERTEIKRELLAPMDSGTDENPSFNRKIDMLLCSIEKVVAEIDAGIKAYEEEQRKRKSEEIGAVLTEAVESAFDDETFRKSSHFDRWAQSQMTRRNNAWLNATCPMELIRTEIDAEVNRCRDACLMMRQMYRDSSELVRIRAANALALDFDVQMMVAEVAKCIEEEEEARRRTEEQSRVETVTLANSVEQSASSGQNGEPLFSCVMKFVGTVEAFNNLKEYLSINNDIKYAVVEKMTVVK